jgi:glutamyl-tRNA reductase
MTLADELKNMAQKSRDEEASKLRDHQSYLKRYMKDYVPRDVSENLERIQKALRSFVSSNPSATTHKCAVSSYDPPEEIQEEFHSAVVDGVCKALRKEKVTVTLREPSRHSEGRDASTYGEGACPNCSETWLHLQW